MLPLQWWSLHCRAAAVGRGVVSDRTAVTLRDASSLDVVHLGPGEDRGRGPDQQALFAFIAQPMAAWFSAAESAGLAHCLSGDVGPGFRDHLFIGYRDGRLAGVVWHGAAADRPEVAVFGYVWTDPVARGLGIARVLSKRSITTFLADGGQASYLGTTDVAARRVYEDSGYRVYHGAVMRALRPGLEAHDWEDAWFQPGQPASIRDARFDDVAAYTALLTNPEPASWLVRDWTERIVVIPPDEPIASCTRPFLSTWFRHSASTTAVFRVATVASGAVVAAAAVAAPSSGPLAGSGTLEILAHPGHQAAVAALVRDVLERAASLDVREVRAWADRGPRADLLMEAGFHEASVMAGRLAAAGRRFDVAELRAALD